MLPSSVKHLDPQCVVFSLFQPEDIKNMSVVKICVPVSFNALELPTKGGLYDPLMGPLRDKGDVCATCHNLYYSCSGHFGHIDLPLPVYNPLFMSTMFSILRLACLQCHVMQIPRNFCRIFIAQLKLLEAGRVVEALEIAGHLNYLNEQSEDALEEAAKSILSEEAIDKFVQEALSDSQGSPLNAEDSKNIEVLRAKFWALAKEQFVPRKSCIECKEGIPKIALVQNKLMTTILSEENFEGKVVARSEPTFMTPIEAQNHLRALWTNYSDFIMALAPVLRNVKREHPTDAFFVEVVAVPPPKVRPVNFIRDKMNEHPQTLVFQQILEHCIVTQQIAHMVSGGTEEDLGVESRMFYAAIPGETPTEKLHHAWQGLQTAVDSLVDSELGTAGKQANSAGLKQLVSKKEGLIRMHMMGKRVNFAGRTVITPDPNLGVDEIGIPEDFAKILTYPTPVTAWNVSALRDAVLNGPNVYPGATTVHTDNGKVLRVSEKSVTQREGVAKRLLTPSESNSGARKTKMVRRHLRAGDVLLLNRQPTLHRPSIMAHKARVLKGERTFRLHYANCKAYNADFDGDEMNAHFPQSENARAEAMLLVEVGQQYLVPKDGSPLSGLIQDHVVACARLAVRGRFFARAEFCYLLHAALPALPDRARLPRPSALKPSRLWSGKQLLSAVLLNCLPSGRPPPTLTDTCKVPARAWTTEQPRPWRAGGTPLRGNQMTEAEVIIRDGELLCGILDKKHIGSTPYGLAHCVYELYGGSSCMRFLSALGRLFTAFLQREGFTLGVRDILVVPSADKKREQLLRDVAGVGPLAIANALDLPTPKGNTSEDGLPPGAHDHLTRSVAGDKRQRAAIDNAYKQMLDPVADAVARACMPSGLLEPFPANNLQLMVISGAKGSTVNTLQISCLLGQIELEGRRPPPLVSGKPLPSFRCMESAPRAGGFVAGRFLTGIRPQEFFFHCMAGREGLIDTAVKTSRSGYLQRCLVKHLEGLVVAYDGTVRDSDGSIVQYAYGEDGLDVTRAQFFKQPQMSILANNYKAFADTKAVEYLRSACDIEAIKKAKKQVRRWQRHERRRSSGGAAESTRAPRVSGARTWTPDPVAAHFPPSSALEAASERMEALLKTLSGDEAEEQRDALLLRAAGARAAAGEPVGVLAAQSVGEPSTQMTLNTFHFAGRGEMNVTLGIPRLREVLMLASRNPKTPSVTVPLRDGADGAALRRKLRRSLLSETLERVVVHEHLKVTKQSRRRVYCLHMQVLPASLLLREHAVKPGRVVRHVELIFLGQLFSAIKRHFRSSSSLLTMDDAQKTGQRAATANSATDTEREEDADDPQPKGYASKSEEEHSSSEEEGADDEDATGARYRARHAEEREYEEDEDEEEAHMLDSGEGVQETQDREAIELDVKDEKNEEFKVEGFVQEKQKGASLSAKKRVNDVLRRYPVVSAYSFDERHEQWCEVHISMPLSFPRVDLSSLVRTAAERSVLAETPGVKRAFVSDDGILRTDGVNLQAMFAHAETLHLERLHCNDVHAVAETYGIEAARAVLVKEVRDVFRAYGIAVDPRHLLLLADYMTFVGSYEGLSRRGMEASASPLQQMSFESTLAFMQGALIRGRKDALRSPSARVMLGRPTAVGTGACTLHHVLSAF